MIKKLIYDIETMLNIAMTFGTGKTVIRSNQLLRGYFHRNRIIMIAYRWSHEKKTRYLTWGKNEADEKEMIRQFFKLVKEADVIIGKNNKAFDDKHMNTEALLQDIGHEYFFAHWSSYVEDLQQLTKKRLRLPSQSLDYISNEMGLGGKNPMQFYDWESLLYYRMYQLKIITTDNQSKGLLKMSIKDIIKEGKAAEKRMIKYGKKDVDDTLAVYNRVNKYFPATNKVTNNGCRHCGSSDLIKNGTRSRGGHKYQQLTCKSCHRHAGERKILNNGNEGVICS